MKKIEAGFAPLVIIVVIAIIGIGGGTYWFMNHEKISREQLLSDLAAAQDNVVTQSEKLALLQSQFKISHPINTTIQDQSNRAKSIIGAKINIFVPNFEQKVDAEQAAINQILNQWDKKIAADFYSDMRIDSIIQMKEDMAKVKEHIKQLQSILSTVTPGNSGLTVTQIKLDGVALADALKEVDAIVKSLDIAQEIAEAAVAAGFAFESSDDTGTSGSSNTDAQTGSQTTGSQTTGQTIQTPGGAQTPASAVVVVTPEQVAAQQAAVEEAQDKVVEIKVELAKIPEPEDEDETPLVNNDTESQGTTNDQTSQTPGSQSGGTDTTSGSESQSTITPLPPRTGKPKLIQGSNIN